MQITNKETVMKINLAAGKIAEKLKNIDMTSLSDDDKDTVLKAYEKLIDLGVLVECIGITNYYLNISKDKNEELNAYCNTCYFHRNNDFCGEYCLLGKDYSIGACNEYKEDDI